MFGKRAEVIELPHLFQRSVSNVWIVIPRVPFIGRGREFQFQYRAALYDLYMCSGSVVVTTYDSESGRPGSNPEWGLIYYEASITAQGLLDPSFLRGSTLVTRAAEHEGCNWGMRID